ncbi:helix-turn-helix transcriptional regulator [Vibrio mediterranei]|uniref:helix-turn-helix transcriptional regulator n=1 Tax=Vibrio mediterranei TaxID=689 RepID=UPI004068E016
MPWQEAIFDAVIFRLMVELYQNSLILDILELEDHKNIIDCISEAISNDLERKWKVEDLAKALNMSKPTLQRKLKETGSDFSQTINTCRLHQARKLLMYTDYSVSQIAMKCGFDSHAYFSSLFKKRYGTTPREFKNYVTFSTYR